MFIRRMLVGLVCSCAILAPCAVQASNAVDWSYSLTNLGGNEYSYTFNFDNQGPDKDAIFKIDIGDLGAGWNTVSFETPTGWSASSSGSGLDFQTDNGSLNNRPAKGQDRIWGSTGAPYGPGFTSGSFTWIFTDTGSTLPTANSFTSSDVTLHLQTIGCNWANNGCTYPVHPLEPVNPVPEPSSVLAMLCGLVGIGSFMWRKRM